MNAFALQGHWGQVPSLVASPPFLGCCLCWPGGSWLASAQLTFQLLGREKWRVRSTPLLKAVTWKLPTSLPPTPIGRNLAAGSAVPAAGESGDGELQLGSHVPNTGVAVSSSCSHKLPQTQWLQTTQSYCPVQEVGGPEQVGCSVFLLEVLEENRFPCLSRLQEAACVAWLTGPSLHRSSLCLCQYINFWLFCFPVPSFTDPCDDSRPAQVTQGLLRILCLIIAAKSLFPDEVTYSQAQELAYSHMWGHYSVYMILGGKGSVSRGRKRIHGDNYQSLLCRAIAFFANLTAVGLFQKY